MDHSPDSGCPGPPNCSHRAQATLWRVPWTQSQTPQSAVVLVISRTNQPKKSGHLPGRPPRPPVQWQPSPPLKRNSHACPLHSPHTDTPSPPRPPQSLSPRPRCPQTLTFRGLPDAHTRFLRPSRVPASASELTLHGGLHFDRLVGSGPTGRCQRATPVSRAPTKSEHLVTAPALPRAAHHGAPTPPPTRALRGAALLRPPDHISKDNPW